MENPRRGIVTNRTGAAAFSPYIYYTPAASGNSLSSSISPNLHPSIMSIIPIILSPFASSVWDPFDLDEERSPAYGSFENADWNETSDELIYVADVPGLRKDEVKVEVQEQKVLKISGEKKGEDKSNKAKFLHSVSLPEEAKPDDAKAVLENGVLTVTVPKEKGVKFHGRVIEISG